MYNRTDKALRHYVEILFATATIHSNISWEINVLYMTNTDAVGGLVRLALGFGTMSRRIREENMSMSANCAIRMI